MRGADEQINTMSDLYDRFIPTCVGQTNDALMLSIVVPGSSPHAWGRHTLSYFNFGAFSVHPHMRGADEQVRICTSHDSFYPDHGSHEPWLLLLSE